MLALAPAGVGEVTVGTDLAALLAASGTPTPRTLRLANGLVVWLVARLQMQAGTAAAKPASPAPQPVAGNKTGGAA